MANKILKKKSFLAKLPAKAKVALAALALTVMGGGAAFALTQSDASLQSKASLTCEDSCTQACGLVRESRQGDSCVTSCVSKCNANRSRVPAACGKLEHYLSVIKKEGELSRRQVAVARRTLKETGEDYRTGWDPPSTQSFLNWYNNRCVIKEVCQPNWKVVVDMSVSRRRTYPTVEGDANPYAKQTSAQYYWPDGCRGRAPLKGEKVGCTSAMVALNSVEVTQYQAWVKAGRPEIKNLCTSSTNCTPIPERCNGDYIACKLTSYVNWCPPEPSPRPTPVACTKDLKACPDGTKVGRTGPNCEFVCPNSSKCSPPPSCQAWQTLVTGDPGPERSQSPSCPSYRCVDKPD